MRLALPILCAIAMGASPALAQIDYSNPAVEIILDRQQILDYTSVLPDSPATGISTRFLVVNSDGNLVFVDRGNTGNANFGQARLIEVDLSGPNPIFTTLASELELAELLETSVAADQPPGTLPQRLNFTGMTHRFVDGTDYYYLANFGQFPNNCPTCADEILEVAVDSSGAVSLRRVGSIDGVVALSVFGDNLYFTLNARFSNSEDYDGIWKMNIATGETEPIVDYIDFLVYLESLPPSDRFPNTMGLEGAAMGMSPDGIFYFFSEDFAPAGITPPAGTADTFTIDPSTFVADPREAAEIDLLIDYRDWLEGGIYANAGGRPGLASLVVDSNNTLYGFDQFPDAGTRRLIIREENGTVTFLNLPTILNVASGRLFFPNNSFQVVVESESKIVLYGLNADVNVDALTPQIVRFTFTDPNVVEPEVPGDINGDGVINVADVTELANLLAATTPPSLAVGDLNDDGVVDAADLEILASSIVNP